MSAETMSLLEKTARRLCERYAGDAEDWLSSNSSDDFSGPRWMLFVGDATEDLRALGVTEEQMAGLASAVVVVPVEPTHRMLVAACAVDDAAYVSGSQHGATDEDIYGAMIAARPGAPE